MAYQQANESFMIVLREVNSISGANEAQAMRKCDNIEIEMVRLHNSLETCVENSNEEIERLQNQLKQLNAVEVTLTDEEKSLKEKENSLNADKKKADSKEKSLKSEMRSLNRKIDEAREKIEEEEKKREEAVLSVASLGLYDLFKGKSPGYSLVNGLISVLRQEKENLEFNCYRLEREVKDTKNYLKGVLNELEAINLKRVRISNELSVIRNRIKRIGEKIQKRGQDFTESCNVLKGLKISQSQFALVKKDLPMILACVGVLEKDILNDFINDFIRQFRDTHQHFLAICC